MTKMTCLLSVVVRRRRLRRGVNDARVIRECMDDNRGMQDGPAVRSL